MDRLLHSAVRVIHVTAAGSRFLASSRLRVLAATFDLLSCLFLAAVTANAQVAADASGQQALKLFNAKQYAAAKDQAKAGVASGGVVSMYVVGEIYSSGKGATQDYSEAATWFRKAADAGYPPAMNAMGSAHETGHGVEQNLALAAEWYRRSVDKGDGAGMNSLGHMFEIGGGVPKDYVQAFQWYLKGAEAGAPAAMVHLGLMYENGHAVNQAGQPTLQDFGEALKWYEKAAQGGDAGGMYRLALSYEIGKGSAPNRPLAMEWYRKAADMGSDAARARLGNEASGSQAGSAGPVPAQTGPGTMGPDGVYRIGNGVSAPTAISAAWVDPTEVAKKLRVHGEVDVDVVVEPDGTVRDPKVVGSMGYGLDERAIEVARKWRFKPALKDGHPVPVAAAIGCSVSVPGPTTPDIWNSGPMVFAAEYGLTPPVVRDGAMPKAGGKDSNESVILDFTVDSTGSVKDIQPVRGSKSGSDLLSAYLAGWRFRPAVKNGQPIEATGRVLFVRGKGDEASNRQLSPPLLRSNPSEPEGAPEKNAPSRKLNLLALYKFRSDGSDSTGVSGPFSPSKNAFYRDGSLYLSGVYEFALPKDGYPAVATVPRLNYLHFTVALDFKAETFDGRRSVILYGGTLGRWWGLRWRDGVLELTLNNGSFRYLFDAAKLSQRAWHNVICSVDLSAGAIRTVLDGKALQDIQLRPGFRLEVIGSRYQVEAKNFTFADYSSGTVFQGYVNNLRIYGDSMSATELQTLYQSIANQTPDPMRTGSPGEGLHDTMVNKKDGQAYVWIPPGSFTMGCSEGDAECGENEKPPHIERIEDGFWLGRTEVTQAAYQRVTGDNPSAHKGDQLPVESVTWNEAQHYCAAIGGYLPTEVEWEYAARAGTKGARYGSPDAIAWYLDNSGNTNQPVAQKQPNAFGLYDMLGNVWEWMENLYGETELRVVRGGARSAVSQDARASHRMKAEPSLRDDDKGFRCAGTWPLPEKTPASVSGTKPDGDYHSNSNSNSVSQPKLLRHFDPEYSEPARKAKLEGVVKLQIDIDAKGNVVDPKVMKSLGLGLDEKAIEAVRKWKFDPGRKDGKPVAVHGVPVEMNFRLL